MGLLGKKEMLSKDTVNVFKVDLGVNASGEQEWVFVREMTGRERDKLENSLVVVKKDEKGMPKDYDQNLIDYRAKIVALCACDENGKNILNYEDYPILSTTMGAKKLDKIANAAQEFNGLKPENKEDKVKNSEPAQTDNSISDFAGN